MNRLILSVLAAIVMAFSSPGARADETIILSQAELGKLFPGSFQAVVNGAVTVKITARGNGTLDWPDDRPRRPWPVERQERQAVHCLVHLAERQDLLFAGHCR